MKKILGGICVLSLMGMGLPATYADEGVAEATVDEKMMYDDMSYYYPTSDFNLKYIEEKLNGRNGNDVIVSDWDMISGNSVSEDYEYNSTHYYSKKMSLNVYIPEGLSRYIQKAHITFKKEDGGPIMYDSMSKDMGTDAPETAETISIDLDLAALDTGVEFDPAMLRALVTDIYGGSFTAQVELTMSNGTVIPFSNASYIYVQADDEAGKIAHLSNYYYTLNPGYGYPDLDGLLKVAFMKLRTASTDTESYVASLKKVALKVDAYTEKYTADQASMVKDISSEADFEKVVTSYGKIMARSNLLYDIKYRVESEMLNDDAQELIDELFEQE